MTQDRIWCEPASGTFVNTWCVFPLNHFLLYHRSKKNMPRPSSLVPKVIYFVYSCGYFNELFLVTSMIKCFVVTGVSIFRDFSVTDCSQMIIWSFILSDFYLSGLIIKLFKGAIRCMCAEIRQEIFLGTLWICYSYWLSQSYVLWWKFRISSFFEKKPHSTLCMSFSSNWKGYFNHFCAMLLQVILIACNPHNLKLNTSWQKITH